jgi:hypothetical protein
LTPCTIPRGLFFIKPQISSLQECSFKTLLQTSYYLLLRISFKSFLMDKTILDILILTIKRKERTMEYIEKVQLNHFGDIISFQTNTGRIISYRKALQEAENGLIHGAYVKNKRLYNEESGEEFHQFPLLDGE